MSSEVLLEECFKHSDRDPSWKSNCTQFIRKLVCSQLGTAGYSVTRVSRRLDNVYPNVSIDFKAKAIVLAVLEPLNQIQVPEQGTTNVWLLCVRACVRATCERFVCDVRALLFLTWS